MAGFALGGTDFARAAIGATELTAISVGGTDIWSAKKTLNYTFTALPTGLVDVAITAGAGVAAINSNAIRETARSSGSGYFYSAALMPVDMGTELFVVTVTNAAQSSSQRGVGAGVFSADGTKGVFCIFKGNTSGPELNTWVGGVMTTQATVSGVYSTSSSDQLALEPSVDVDGVVTWTVTKNGGAVGAGLSWTDDGHLIDLPGKRAATCFKHQYSGGEFYSPGISALTASDL